MFWNRDSSKTGSHGLQQPSMTMSALPVDVHHLIQEHLEWPHDLHALSLVDKYFNHLATPYLYRTVAFCYMRPTALYNLLCKLESSPNSLCLQIQTLIFDDVPKPLCPPIPWVNDAEFGVIPSKKLENRLTEPIGRKLHIHNQIHHKLYSVLPLLSNLKSLHLRRLHPIFLSPPLSHAAPSDRMTAATRVKDTILNHVPIKQWRNYSLLPSSETHFHRLPPAALAMFFTHCHSLTHLTIYDPLSLRSYWPPSLLSNLTVLTIALNLDSVLLELDVEDSRAMQFNSLLRRAKSLKSLCILTTWINLTVLLEECYFPYLESIEWFHYRAKNPDDPATFYYFLKQHSATLKHIALAPVAYIVGNWGYTIAAENDVDELGVPIPHWLEQPPTILLPNLETLRLHNWHAWALPQPVYTVPKAAREATARVIAEFILKRPSIVDVALSDFPEDVARELTGGMRDEGRVLKRCVVGTEEMRQRDARVPPYPPFSARHSPIHTTEHSAAGPSSSTSAGIGLGSGTSGTGTTNQLLSFNSTALASLAPSGLLFGGPESERARLKAAWAFTRKREYLHEAYHSYHLMFQGMELENSGFRPYLLPRRKNAKRDYRR